MKNSLSNFLIASSLIILSFGQLGKIYLLENRARLYIYEIILLVIFFIFNFKYKLSPYFYFFRSQKIGWFFFLYLWTNFFIQFQKYKPITNLIGFLYLSRLFFYFLFCQQVAFFFLKEKKNRLNLKIILLVINLIFVFFGLSQYYLYPNLRNLYYLGWDPHQFRLFGTFFDTFLSASILGIGLFFVLNQIYEKNKRFNKFNKLILSLITILIFISFMLTLSRGALISFIFSLIFFFNNKSIIDLKKVVPVFLLFFFTILMLIPKPFGEGVNLLRTKSIIARLDDYNQAIFFFKQNPIFGIGYNRIMELKNGHSSIPDNAITNFTSSYLTIIVSGGLVGLLLMIFWLYDIFKITFVGKEILIFLFLFSLFDNVILHPIVIYLATLTLIALNVKSQIKNGLKKTF